MFKTKIKLGLVAVAAASAALPLLAVPASADLAPSTGDVVGVGSDTLQYASDFIADGDFLGDTGWNVNVVNRIVNFDATPDADARLAYGSPGVGTGNCPPGLGATAGTGNATGSHADQPCVLNPTIVLRQGLTPVLRPNGSGAGGKAGLADTHKYINYVRASSAQGSTLSSGTPSLQWDSITIGTDPLAMLRATTSNAPALSVQQLKLIYNCTDTTWTSVGGTSTDTIIPIIPQIGSGTRSTFLSDIGLSAPGACVQTGEENDPFAITNIPASLSPVGSSADAIEPMSGGRLNMFLGIAGSNNGNAAGPNGVGGYFQDPSCAVEVTTPAACVGTARTLTPHVTLVTTGTPSDSNPVFDSSRNLYIYFRDSDINSGTPFEPTSSLNYVRSLFYDPPTTACPGTGCVTIGGVNYGPAGPPFYASSAGQALIASAGINATYSESSPGA